MSGDRGTGQLTGQEWEARLGQSLHDLRVARNLSLGEVAGKAGLDSSDVERIENGGGGSVGAFVQIARVLGQEKWLEALAPVKGPAPGMSPLQRLRERQAEVPLKRVFGRGGSKS